MAANAVEANPSFVSSFREWVGTPSGQQTLASALLRLVERAEQICRCFELIIAGAAAIVGRIEPLFSGPEVPGFEAFLRKEGYDADGARFVARVMMHSGKMLAEEHSVSRSLGSAVLAVANCAGRSSLVMARRARPLKEFLDKGLAHHVITSAIAKAALSFTLDDLRRISDRAVARDENACRELGKIAQAILPHMPSPRGRPISVATCTHVLMYHALADMGRLRTYSWRADGNDFADGATQATRLAINDWDFDPRSARRLFKRGKP
jgi:hypothetical protein